MDIPELTEEMLHMVERRRGEILARIDELGDYGRGAADAYEFVLEMGATIRRRSNFKWQ